MVAIRHNQRDLGGPQFMLKDKIVMLAQIGVWFGLAIALLGSFEQANDSGSPFWSSVLGFPFIHHYLLGFIILAVSLLIVYLFGGGKLWNNG